MYTGLYGSDLASVVASTSSLADSATLSTTLSGVNGLMIVEADGKTGAFFLQGTDHFQDLSDPSFSPTQGTAGCVNCYYDTTEFKIENKTGGAISCSVAFYSTS